MSAADIVITVMTLGVLIHDRFVVSQRNHLREELVAVWKFAKTLDELAKGDGEDTE